MRNRGCFMTDWRPYSTAHQKKLPKRYAKNLFSRFLDQSACLSANNRAEIEHNDCVRCRSAVISLRCLAWNTAALPHKARIPALLVYLLISFFPPFLPSFRSYPPPFHTHNQKSPFFSPPDPFLLSLLAFTISYQKPASLDLAILCFDEAPVCLRFDHPYRRGPSIWHTHFPHQCFNLSEGGHNIGHSYNLNLQPSDVMDL